MGSGILAVPFARILNLPGQFNPGWGTKNEGKPRSMKRKGRKKMGK